MSRLSEMLAVPSPESINSGLTNARQATMLALLGKPRSSVTTDCAAVTHPNLKNQMVTESVGPFRVTGHRLAVTSLRVVMAQIKIHKPQAYAEIRTAGMLCCRAVRGSKTDFSNHSWGTAVDLYFGEVVDELGDGKVQRGLLEVYPYFHKEGWFWGAEWKREDAMHFEVADETIRLWKKQGKL